MNQELLDPFIVAQELPEVLSGKLRQLSLTSLLQRFK